MTNLLSLLSLFICTILLLSFGTLRGQHRDAFAVQTQIAKGHIEGLYDTRNGLQRYLGIPFAKPPVGELRWKAPQPLEPWEGVKMTKNFGPRPMQSVVFGDMNSRSDGVSEDCLYLNVWTPAKRNTTGLPVLVYFYGGGFVAGDGSEPRYDGASMAQLGMVVVTVNYRLNVFGFLAHPELSAEAPYGSSGNYGLLDQVASLEWVRDNIAAFGGDPDRVTIAGESAGSISVSLHMASPLSKGLFAGAIGESGAAIMPTLPPTTLVEVEQAGKEFAMSIGAPSLAELRALSTRDLYESYNESGRFGFPSAIDGYFLTATLPEVFRAKQQAQVPLLLGWNSAEIPGIAFLQGQPSTPEAFVTKVKEAFPGSHAEILQLYPHKTESDVLQSSTDLASDRFIAYSTWLWFDLHRKNSDQPVYRYLYSKLRPPLVDQSLASGLAGGTVSRESGAPAMPPALGAPHACEIEYCMGNLPLVKEYAWTDDDFQVSKTMQLLFAQFIKTGNPNGENLPTWEAAQAGDTQPPVMVIDVISKQRKALDDARYVSLDKFFSAAK